MPGSRAALLSSRASRSLLRERKRNSRSLAGRTGSPSGYRLTSDVRPPGQRRRARGPLAASTAGARQNDPSLLPAPRKAGAPGVNWLALVTEGFDFWGLEPARRRLTSPLRRRRGAVKSWVLKELSKYSRIKKLWKNYRHKFLLDARISKRYFVYAKLMQPSRLRLQLDTRERSCKS
jgi:hypothetical protein